MSNVLKRNRSISDMEYYKNALIIRDDIENLCDNPEIFPDKLSYNKLRASLIDSVYELMSCIRKANSVYAMLECEYNLKVVYQDRAIASCEDLIEQLQHLYMKKKLYNSTTNKEKKLSEKIQKIGRDLVNEHKYLKGWKHKSKKQFENSRVNKNDKNNLIED